MNSLKIKSESREGSDSDLRVESSKSGVRILGIRDLNLQRAVFGSVFVDCDQWFDLDLNLSEIGVWIRTCVVLDSIKIQDVRSGVHHLIPHQC